MACYWELLTVDFYPSFYRPVLRLLSVRHRAKPQAPEVGRAGTMLPLGWLWNGGAPTFVPCWQSTEDLNPDSGHWEY